MSALTTGTPPPLSTGKIVPTKRHIPEIARERM